MFGFRWLKKYVGFAAIKESDRNIFRYWDGQRQRAIDPITALLAIENHPQYRGDLHPQLVDEGDPEATRITVKMVQDVFGVPAWSEESGGLTILESLSLLTTFCDYMESVKKNIGLSLTLPPPSAPTFDASSPTITKPLSVCG